MLPVAKAAQLSSAALTTAEPNGTPGEVSRCSYTGGINDLEVAFTFKLGKQAYASEVQNLTALGHAPSTVKGVGDQAFALPDPHGASGLSAAEQDAYFGARYGDEYVELSGLTYVDQTKAAQIAELLHSALG